MIDQPTIEHTTYCGRDAVTARTPELEMTVVPAWGSNLVSLKYRNKGIDLLREPESERQFWDMPFLYGVPVLFPPNRIEDGTFSFGGTTYRFKLNEPETNNHSHGIVFEEAWTLRRAETIDGVPTVVTEFESAKYPEAQKQFPHDFVLRLTFRLQGASLRKTVTLINRGDKPIPWGFGYHTTFNFPFRPGGDPKLCKFAIDVDSQWMLTDRFLPTGELRSTDLCAEFGAGVDLSEKRLDDVFLAAPGNDGSIEARLEDRGAGIRVVYRNGEPFRHWVIYNDDGQQGYVSPEPYTWVTNAPNLPLDGGLTGVQVLQPGRETHFDSWIAVTDIE